MKALLDPFSAIQGDVRYPDETITKTAIVQMQQRQGAQCDSPGKALNGWLVARLMIKQGGLNYSGSSVWGVGWDGENGQGNVGSPGDSQYFMRGGYGDTSNTWGKGSAIDRTLAAGIRVKLNGMPSNTFQPSGTLYAWQVQTNELNPVNTIFSEAQARQMIEAGKGFMINLAEVNQMDGITLPYCPQGPMSYVFSDSDNPRYQATNIDGGDLTGGGWNGYAGATVSHLPCLEIMVFGAQEGTTLSIDFGHIVEYIPRVTLAGIITTKAKMPDVGWRQAAGGVISALAQTIGGQTSPGTLAAVLGGKANLDRVVPAVASIAKGLMGGGVAGGLLALGGELMH
jgi:hypothetical protein